MAGSVPPPPDTPVSIVEGAIISGESASDLPHGSEIIEVTVDGRDKPGPWLLTIDGPLDSWMQSKTWRVLRLPAVSS